MHIIKFLSTFVMCAVFFGKFGVPTAMIVYDYDFLNVFIVSMSGGITGNIVFTYLSAAILRAIHNYRVRRGTIHKKRIFTSFNRRVIRAKNRFGLKGIAFIGPMFLSLPLSTFLAERFFRNKKKIIIYFTVSELFWNIVLYFVIISFQEQLKGWLI